MSDSSGHKGPILRAADVHRAFEMGPRKLEVLRGVNLAIDHGEFIALKGASGAGKSTLLHLLGGLDSPDGGEIRFRDRNLGRFSGGELNRFRNRHVGFVFQAYHLLPDLDALENVCLPSRMARESAGRVAARARNLLTRVGLGERMDHRSTELSGGERQRVAIARALMNDPDLILADEPTGNLDSHTGEEIIALLAELRTEREVTLVIATHDNKVAEAAPRIVELVDGAVAD